IRLQFLGFLLAHDVVHREPGLRVEDGAPVALVIFLGVVPNAEQIHRAHPAPCARVCARCSGGMPKSMYLPPTFSEEQYSAYPSSNHRGVGGMLPLISMCAYSWNTTPHPPSEDRSSAMKLRSSPAWKNPASSTARPFHTGPYCFNCLPLRKATICSGTGEFNLAR